MVSLPSLGRCKRMKHFPIKTLFIFTVCGVSIWTFLASLAVSNESAKQPRESDVRPSIAADHSVTISLTICGQANLAQSFVAIKSALMFENSLPLHFVLLTERDLMGTIDEKMKWFQVYYPKLFTYELMLVQFPSERAKTWRSLFKPCASQRLFLPKLVPWIDSLIYLDTDVLFLSPPSHLWFWFINASSSIEGPSQTALASLAYETTDLPTNWYHKFARHPFYGDYGVNSGVMVMNLTRMRAQKWTERIESLFSQYRGKLVWGDQDLINIYFHHRPHELIVFPCSFNFRPDHCIYSLICDQARMDGIKLLHGNRGTFLNGKYPIFSQVYQALDAHQPGNRNATALATEMRLSLAKLTRLKTKKLSNCFAIRDLIVDSIAGHGDGRIPQNSDDFIGKPTRSEHAKG